MSFPPEPDAEPGVTETPEPVTETSAEEPAPIPTGFPEPPAPAEPGGVTVTDTGALIYPQPMPPAKPGFVNLATVPPMVSLTVPPETEGGEAAVIDVYGTEVDTATAERAYAAAATAGFSLREL